MDTVASSPAETRQKAIDWLLIITGLSLIILACSLLSGWWVWSHWPISLAPKVESYSTLPEPVQTAVSPAQSAPIVWEKGGYVWQVTPKATYSINARVLSRETYLIDWQSPAVPLDLALGWGEMADPAVDEWITWRQANRWYFYRWPNDAPFTGAYIGEHSANVHIIPATEALLRTLQRVGKNDVIQLDGQLVDLAASSGAKRWVNATSLIRTDKGDGACEIMYVERLVWNGREYR